MIDKNTEAGIKSLKSFLEFWEKFHSLYNDSVSKGIISTEDEAKFLETKEVIKNKYGGLRRSLDFRYVPRGRLTDPVNDCLSITGIRLMSERNMKKLNEDWRDSYIFLNSILERLENNRRRLGQFSPLGVLFKRIFDRR